MTLSEAQRLFTFYLPRLLDHVQELGLECSVGEAYRTPEQAQWNAEHGIGIAHSLHTDRLAIDLNLFKDGAYTDDLDDYRPLGEYWKGLTPAARWGGDFTSPDADHFSIAWEGRA